MSTIGGRPAYPFKVGDNATGQCSSCGLVFYGAQSFDLHRQGDGEDRHCADPAETRPDKSGRTHFLDPQGRWRHGPPIATDVLAAREDARTARIRAATRSRSDETPYPATRGGSDDSVPPTGHTANGDPA